MSKILTIARWAVKQTTARVRPSLCSTSSGDTNDSATMNIWLHKQVLIKLAANGGKLSADLKI
jgi:hypothetical protein